MTDPLVEQLIDAGVKAVSSARPEDAEKLLARAEEHARTIKDQAALVRALSWRGVTLIDVGEYDRALISLVEAIKTGDPGVDPEDQYRAMVHTIRVFCRVRPLRDITRLIDETDRQLKNWGRREWGHKLLCIKSSLLVSCGRAEEAKPIAWESLRLVDRDPDSQTFTRQHHLCVIAECCFRTGDESGLDRLQRESERTESETEYGRVRKAEIGFYVARLRTRHNFLPLALADQAEDTIGIDPTSNSIRVIALARQWQRARKAFDKAVANHSDLSDFELGLLDGDLHLMRVREELQLPCVDDEITIDDSVHSGKAGANPIVRELLELARTRYRVAEIVAIREDCRLETKFFSGQLKKRRNSVTQMFGMLDN